MKQQTESGFSLVEVIVALVIATGALAAIYQAVTTSLAALHEARRREEALLLARSLLDGAGIESELRAGHSTGRLDNGATWQLTATPLSIQRVALTESRPWKIEVVVHDRSGSPLVSLTTIRLTGKR